MNTHKRTRPAATHEPTVLLPMLGFASLLLVACATKPSPPTAQLQAAQSAITTAEQARIADDASPELTEAREKLAAANEAVRKEDMVGAQRLAEVSRVDAELATAKAGAAKAQTVNDEMKKSTQALEVEMKRNTGVAP